MLDKIWGGGCTILVVYPPNMCDLRGKNTKTLCEDDMKVTLGDKIAYARQMAHLDQKQLAKRAGLYAADIKAYEKDEKKPSRDTLLKICKACKLRGDYFEEAIPAPDPNAPKTFEDEIISGMAQDRGVPFQKCERCGKPIYPTDRYVARDRVHSHGRGHSETVTHYICMDCEDAAIAQAKKNRAKNAQSLIRKGLGWSIALLIIQLVIEIVLMVFQTTVSGRVTAGVLMGVSVIFVTPFIAQLFWHGLIVKMFPHAANEVLWALPLGIITAEFGGGILFIFKLILAIISIPIALVAIWALLMVSLVVSPFSFFPALNELKKTAKAAD